MIQFFLRADCPAFTIWSNGGTDFRQGVQENFFFPAVTQKA
jgi:hypothetical protein